MTVFPSNVKVLNSLTEAFRLTFPFIVVAVIFSIAFPVHALDIPSEPDTDVAFQAHLKKYREIDWERYTVEEIRKKTPGKFYGNDVTLLPVQTLSFLPMAFPIEMKPIWKAAGIPRPDTIVVANGVYDLKRLHRLIADPSILKRVNTGTYIAYRPLYVAPTATLVIRGKELRLSLRHGASLLYHGKLYLVDAHLLTWDEKTGDYGPREKIPDKELFLFGRQSPRPYLLGLHGSKIYAGNTVFEGLGFQGRSGSYGIALLSPRAKEPVKTDLRSEMWHRKKATGWFIGNTMSRIFFGFYTNAAHDVVFVGNVLYDSVVYNIDPHDFSYRLLIARNLTYRAGLTHGIIISREVNDSIIAENLSFKNSGSGIMLDRDCKRNLIIDNVALENPGDGIAIYESDHNLVLNNTVARNGNNGIYVRNSCRVQVENNHVFRNGNNGAEVAVVDINYQETRDFVVDPYRKLSQADFLANEFDGNLNSALAVKNGAGIYLRWNRFKNSAPLYFSGDLESLSHRILMQNQNKGFNRIGTNGCP